MNTRTLALALGSALALAPAAAVASSPSVAVEYHDLNLTTRQGMAELDRRIDAAARQVCDIGEQATGTRLPSSAAKRCYEQARQQVKEQVAAIVENKRKG